MTPESQRIAIAEATGRKVVTIGFIPFGYWTDDPKEDGHQLPNYLNDLNAMHEAEKVLTDDQMEKATFMLWEIVLQENATEISMSEFSSGAWITVYLAAKVQRATATQRAEAFLRTLGLWKD